MQHPCGAAGQSLHLLVAQPHGSQALSAGAAQDRDPRLAQGAEGTFGVCGVPARPGKQALFGFSLKLSNFSSSRRKFSQGYFSAFLPNEISAPSRICFPRFTPTQLPVNLGSFRRGD